MTETQCVNVTDCLKINTEDCHWLAETQTVTDQNTDTVAEKEKKKSLSLTA